MRISVIICTYNRAEILRETLQGFVDVAGDAPSPWELILVDNNSKDATKEVCECFAGKIPLIYIHEPRQGQSVSVNTGIEAAKADLIALTDDDVNVDPRWMNAYVEAAATHATADFFGGKVISKWQEPPPRWFLDNVDMIRSNPRIDLGEDAIKFTRGSAPVFIGANMALRRSLFEKGYKFREDLGPQGDGKKGGQVGPYELEWETRVMEGGYEGVYVPRSVVNHRDPPWRMTEKYVRHWYAVAGRIRVRLGEVPAGREWFGAPRYLWREWGMNFAKYVSRRAFPPTRVWVEAMCRMSIAWGSITEYRKQLRESRNERKNPTHALET